ncbi:MAG TPA: ABC transporter permease [Mycobacteriales bacterium]|nr:ABC transporter permease [Mycobacteriales bacterium]
MAAGARAAGGRVSARLMQAYTWLIIFWLMLPIFVIIAFGFNNTKGKFNYTWQGLTLHWYRTLFAIPDLTNALVNSITIALLVTAISALLGTPMGFALGRWRFRGTTVTELTLFSNIAAPEITLATALLSLFITANIPRGYWTIVIAQVMFDIAYVAVTVRARMAGYDVHLEEAARDLGAGPFTTFRLVTLPLLLPGIIAGCLLAFALSIDDFVITQFNAGQTLTFPLWVFGATRLGVPPQVNVMGTLIFLGGVLIAITSVILARRRT